MSMEYLIEKNLQNQLNYMHEVDTYFECIIRECSSGIPLNGQGNSGPNFHAYLSNHNRDFYNSQYYYKKPMKFIHFTSIRNLMSICKSKSIRMYNMINSNDVSEYDFAASEMGLSKGEIEYYKKRIFTFSFCELSELYNKKIWQNYGHDFQGAAVGFKFFNNAMLWENYHISAIQYDNLEPFQKYRQRIEKLLNRFGSISARCDLSSIIGFHKSSQWSWEKEIRLLANNPFINEEDYMINANIDIRSDQFKNVLTRYVDLPISLDKVKSKNELEQADFKQKEPYLGSPMIKLEKIYLTSQCNLCENRTAIAEIEIMLEANFGYRVGIEIINDFNN